MHQPITLRSRVWEHALTGQAMLRALRPHQWVKNLLLFAALIFSGSLASPEHVTSAILGFACFCAGASAVYLLNDLMDLEQDRRHPDKCRRPLASGAIPVFTAVLMMVILGFGSVMVAFLLRKGFAFLLVTYLILNIGYCLRVKHSPVLDVLSIAIGFVIRAVAGAVAIYTLVSAWMVLCTMMLALLVGFGKRRQELASLQEHAGEHRAVLQGYTLPLLDNFMAISAGASIVTYSLYTMAPDTIARYGSKSLVLSIPFVIFGVFRYLMLVMQQCEGGDPARLFVKDRPLLINAILWMLTCAGVVYNVIFWPFW